MAKIRKFHKK